VAYFINVKIEFVDIKPFRHLTQTFISFVIEISYIFCYKDINLYRLQIAQVKCTLTCHTHCFRL